MPRRRRTRSPLAAAPETGEPRLFDAPQAFLDPPAPDDGPSLDARWDAVIADARAAEAATAPALFTPRRPALAPGEPDSLPRYGSDELGLWRECPAPACTRGRQCSATPLLCFEGPRRGDIQTRMRPWRPVLQALLLRHEEERIAEERAGKERARRDAQARARADAARIGLAR
ncbi:MAG: hypothetical protein AAF311_14610 [Pseudomonadota bacterium]